MAHSATLPGEHAGGAPQTLTASVSKGRLIFIVIGTLLGMMLGALDQTVVGTAMPRIITELGGAGQLSLVYTAYLLASTVMVPIYGKLSDIYGRRIFFLGGMLIFLLGSALSGTSQNMTQLILYRALQGLGAGSLMPIAQAIIGDVFPPSERGKWQGLMMSVFGLATILGPLAGGWITDNWGWRWVFYVNMPVGIVALITTGLAMPGMVRRVRHTIDYLGSMALMLAAVPLLIGFSLPGTSIGGQSYSWSSPLVIGSLAFAVLMTLVFLLVELRAPEPIISPRLFTSSIFTVSVISTFLLTAGMFGAILYLPYFVQDVLGDSATNSGIILMPMMLGFMVSSLIGGQLLSRTGRYKILAIVSFAIGVVGMALLSRMTVATTQATLVRNMVVTGLGIGTLMSLFTIVVQNAFPFRQLGEVTAGLQFFRSIGGTIGIAIMGTVLTNGLTTGLQQNLPPAIKSAMASGKLQSAGGSSQDLLDQATLARIHAQLAAFGPQGQVLYNQLILAIHQSLATAIAHVFLLGAIVMVIGFIATFFLKEIPLRKSNQPGAAPESVEGDPVEAVTPMLG